MPDHKPLFRTALACKIVGLDRLRFNDAVANGVYTCAPPTAKGSSRLFDADAMIPLYLFARLTDFGITAGRAGAMACDVASTLKQDSYRDNDRITLVRGTRGEHFRGSAPLDHKGDLIVKEVYDPDHEKNGFEYRGAGRVILTVDFYISHIRSTIADGIADELRKYGQDDEADA